MFVCSGLRYTSHWEGIQKVRRGPCSHGALVKLITESFVKQNLVWHRLGGTWFGASQPWFKICAPWPLPLPAFSRVILCRVALNPGWDAPTRAWGTGRACDTNLQVVLGTEKIFSSFLSYGHHGRKWGGWGMRECCLFPYPGCTRLPPAAPPGGHRQVRIP